jgi:hypothetical protein
VASTLSRLAWCAAWACGLSTSVLAAGPRAPRPVTLPSLSKKPLLDGNPSEWTGPELPLTPAQPGLELKAALHANGLVVGARWKNPAVAPGQITLRFAGAGVAASGAHWTRPTSQPLSADETVRWFVQGSTFEVWVSPLAFPPFPANGALTAELCVAPEGSDASALACGSLKLPAMFRKRAPPVKPPVATLQERAHGWLGFDAQGNRIWARGAQALTASSLAALVDDQPLLAEPLGIFIPQPLETPGGSPMAATLSGVDPFLKERCDTAAEVRLILWAVKGDTAVSLLEWPVMSCELGRASSVVPDAEGGLTIGYAGGATVTFTWADDHFERTELGTRNRSPFERPGLLNFGKNLPGPDCFSPKHADLAASRRGC